MKSKLQFRALFAACILGTFLVGCGSDNDSASGTPNQEIMVEKSINALIQSADGTALKDAQVTIAGQSVVTDEYGLASLKVSIAQSVKKVVVTFKKDGFVTQAMVYDVANIGQVTANLLAVKQSITVNAIEQAQMIESAFLGARITIPENAFVKADGTVATGVVNVQFTPWDISGSDLNAMPANGIAIIDPQGNTGTLISAGMITATFTDADGHELQLAKGKTADIQMHLPVNSINNQAMSVGTTIPMWHFNESKGLWEEDGVGTVVADASSATGLAVHATVSHFSTWNWDFKFENPGSVNVQCQAAGQGVPCHITAKVELGDGSGLTKLSSIPAEGVQIINMPNSGSIYWSAKDTTGTLIGSAVSSTSGKVIIDLGTPKTNNVVKCQLSNGKAVSCNGAFTAKVKGIDKTTEFTADQYGARVLSGLEADNNVLNWSAYTAVALENNQWVRYKGTAVSNSTENVKIILKDKEVIASDKGLKFQVQCTSYDYNTNNEFVDPLLKGKPCEVQVNVFFYKDNNQLSETFIFSSVYGQTRQVQLPNFYTGFQWLNEGNVSYINLQSRMLNKQYCGFGDGTEGFHNNENPLFKFRMYLSGTPADASEFCEMPR